MHVLVDESLALSAKLIHVVQAGLDAGRAQVWQAIVFAEGSIERPLPSLEVNHVSVNIDGHHILFMPVDDVKARVAVVIRRDASVNQVEKVGSVILVLVDVELLAVFVAPAGESNCVLVSSHQHVEALPILLDAVLCRHMADNVSVATDLL